MMEAKAEWFMEVNAQWQKQPHLGVGILTILFRETR